MTSSLRPTRKKASPLRSVLHSEAVVLPLLPSFLKTDSGAVIPIEAVTDAGLRQLGKLWTAALVRMAQNKRKAAKRGE